MRTNLKQQRFTQCIGKLILMADRLGFGLTFGDAYRDPRVFGEFGEQVSYSAAKSCHKVRLAVDFNLFFDGVLIEDPKHIAWVTLGRYWEFLDINARWGGRFKDAGHFSFEYEGYK